MNGRTPLGILRDFVNRATHWQEGGEDRHAALEALKSLSADTAAKVDALQSIKRHCEPLSSALSKAIVATCENGLKGEAIAQPAEPLIRGITGKCGRSTCECERYGLGKHCIWLEPTDAELGRRTGEPHVDGYPLFSGIPPGAQADAPPAEPQATYRAWLVEWRSNGLQWLYLRPRAPGGFSFTSSASEALRFARREDAEAALKWALTLDSMRGLKAPGEMLATEHEWLAQPATVTPLRQAVDRALQL